MSAALDLLHQGAGTILGRVLAPDESDRFRKYLELLLKWQRVHRLVGSARPEWIVENLFLDSLLFLKVLPAHVASVVDVGSGAGFPGIPIKIVRGTLEVCLLESRERRVSFLSAAVRELGLPSLSVFGGRAESVPDSMRSRYGAAVARSAGDPTHVMPVAARLVRPGGVVICSGPPTPRPTAFGEWLEVNGFRAGSVRRFAIQTVSSEGI
jgi:16S rRNA (guanine527-N7)-methyltransferase